MKIFVILSSVLALAASFEYCYNDVIGGCSSPGGELKHCNADYGAAKEVMFDLQSFANLHVTRSFDYLLLSTNFGAYEKNRHGFEKLFRKLSDTMWEDAIDIIKYITKRGGSMDFSAKKEDKLVPQDTQQQYNLYELASLARALDSQKLLAEEAHHIHSLASRHRESNHDPEVASWLENNFLHKHAETIRDLAGHAIDLKKFVAQSSSSSLSVFLFDEYLKSKY